jgi:hypothetical protein
VPAPSSEINATSAVTTHKQQWDSNEGKKICTAAEGCTNRAIKGGRCTKHGGRGSCSIEGCATGVQGRGLCYKHGGGSRTFCTTQGCTTHAVKHGLCTKHGIKTVCQAKGCLTNARSLASGFCRKHEESDSDEIKNDLECKYECATPPAESVPTTSSSPAPAATTPPTADPFATKQAVLPSNGAVSASAAAAAALLAVAASASPRPITNAPQSATSPIEREEVQPQGSDNIILMRPQQDTGGLSGLALLAGGAECTVPLTLTQPDPDPDPDPAPAPELHPYPYP